MGKLSKEQIEQLTPEQQEDLASLELRRDRIRQRLFERARKQSWVLIVLQVVALAGGTYFAVAGALISPWLLVSVLAFAAAIVFETIGINRRLDALVKLLENPPQDGAALGGPKDGRDA